MFSFFASLQQVLPKKFLTYCFGQLANVSYKPVKNALIRAFIRHFNVDMSTALEEDYRVYPTFNAFFIRRLKSAARPLATGERIIVSPVDGAVSQLGLIQFGRIVQAKGFDFTVQELVGGDSGLAERFDHGAFTTLYLSPRDYHRVHMPVSGVLKQTIYIPGTLFSVNQTSVQHIPRLFARNERLVSVFATDDGLMAVVMVGALNVASINTVWSGTITPPHGKAIIRREYSTSEDNRIAFNAGEEMGHFRLGSTAVILFEKKVNWAELSVNAPVMLGQKLGNMLSE